MSLIHYHVNGKWLYIGWPQKTLFSKFKTSQFDLGDHPQHKYAPKKF